MFAVLTAAAVSSTIQSVKPASTTLVQAVSHAERATTVQVSRPPPTSLVLETMQQHVALEYPATRSMPMVQMS